MSQIVYGSVCSGIEAATVAWRPLGWKPAFFSEIEKFPRALLAHHYPNVPLHGDFTTIQAEQYEPINLLVGGTPCQSFSVAGLRGGLDDDRGKLAFEYLRLADRLRPQWLVWENVPGVLSSNGGRDFGSVLGGMVELGYGIAYRVLDAQYFGVPQRRRRVFVVGYFGDWRRASAVLFERESLRGNSAPRRETRKDVAPTISSRPTGGGGLGTDFDLDGGLIAKCLTGHPARIDAETETFVPTIAPCLTRNYGKQPDNSDTNAGHMLVPCLTSNGDAHSGYRDEHGLVLVAFALRGRDDGAQPEMHGDGSSIGALRAAGGGSSRDYLAGRSVVRRLTPEECEALQGFPRGYTAIPYRGGVAADGPRYKALGNSMAVPCMAWIGRRIQMAEEL